MLKLTKEESKIIDDMLKNKVCSETKIKEINNKKRNIKVYNLEVEDDFTYNANDYIVHNTALCLSLNQREWQLTDILNKFAEVDNLELPSDDYKESINRLKEAHPFFRFDTIAAREGKDSIYKVDREGNRDYIKGSRFAYDSDTGKYRPNVSDDYVGNFIEAGIPCPPLHNFCYQIDTEVYTKRGWLLFKNLKDNDLILTLNPETKDLEWSKIIRQISYKYNGKMILFTNNQHSLDLCVTPDHQHFYYKRVDHATKGRWMEPIFANFEQLKKSGSEVMFYISSEWKGEDKKYIEINGLKLKTEDYCRLMGYYLSEGSTKKVRSNSGNYYAQIAQEKFINKMYEDIKDIGLKNITKTKDKIHIYDIRFGNYAKQFGYSYEKYIPEEIMELSPNYIRIFLDAYNLGDGSIFINNNFKDYRKDIKFKELKNYCTSSKKIANQIGELILKVGKSPSFRKEMVKGKKQKFRNGIYIINHNIYIINELSSKYRKPRIIKEIDYNDYVYDIEVEKNHTLWVRRNGKAVWSSNCRSWLTSTQETFDELVETIETERKKDNKNYI